MRITLEKILKKLRPYEYDLVYEDDECVVFLPHTERATAYLSYGTKWETNSGTFSIDNREQKKTSNLNDPYFLIEINKAYKNTSKRLYDFNYGYYVTNDNVKTDFDWIARDDRSKNKLDLMAKYFINYYIKKGLNLNLDFHTYPLSSLHGLKFVRGDLNLENSKLNHLGGLESVEGYLSLVFSEINDLGELKYVGQDLLISRTRISDLGKLQYVGGHIFITDSPLEYIDRSDLQKRYPQFKGKFIG